MDMRRLEYFCRVVELGSITAAAEALHLSQPSLSVALRKLESEAGVPLLTRRSHGVEATAPGRYLIEAAGRVFGEIAEIEATMKQFADGKAGAIAIAGVPVLMWHRLPELLRRLHIRAPEVVVRLTDPPPWTALDLLSQRAVDIAAINVFEADRFAERHSDAFDVHDWGEVPLVAALPPDLSDAPEVIPVDWFAGQVMVLPRRTPGLQSLPEATDEYLSASAVVPREVRVAETIQTSIPLIEAGAAVALLPDPENRSLRRFDVLVRSVTPPPPPLRALLVTRKGASAHPLIARVLGEALGQSTAAPASEPEA